VTVQHLSFPLIPRFRLVGVAFGGIHSARRGLGSDVAGTRPYTTGDDMDAIDWNASAKLSLARDSDEFVVRERFADEAPRVVALCDRRPAMSLYPPGLPWLRKADAMHAATAIVAASAFRARGLFGYLDLADAEEPFWSPPASEPQWLRIEEEYDTRPFSAPVDNVEAGIEFLRFARMALPPGSFVFVLSDFLVTPPPEVWLSAVEHRWDVVPVVIQDPTWEQTFPDVAGLAVPVLDAETGKPGTIRLTRARARELREAHERRLDATLDDLAALGLEPVLVDSTDEQQILDAFLGWADRRLHSGHAWRVGA
jgi:uncharacterized protein (DUF58 family)